MVNGDYTLVVAPEDFIGKKYRGRYCYEHHLVYWAVYGVVPKNDEIIHHKDDNKRNNEIENLELKTRKKHCQEHNLKVGRAMVELKCPYCEVSFIREKNKTYLKGNKAKYSCCCKRCSVLFYNLPALDKQQKLASMPVREFRQYGGLSL